MGVIVIWWGHWYEHLCERIGLFRDIGTSEEPEIPHLTCTRR